MAHLFLDYLYFFKKNKVRIHAHSVALYVSYAVEAIEPPNLFLCVSCGVNVECVGCLCLVYQTKKK